MDYFKLNVIKFILKKKKEQMETPDNESFKPGHLGIQDYPWWYLEILTGMLSPAAT